MKITLATCALNQWALDFTGNLERTKESFRIAREKGAVYRLGPELELCGYGCNDHFLEIDTVKHCFAMLLELMQSQECKDIIGDVGMPIIHQGVRYNCRVIFYNRKILLIRPKKHLANDGNYREMRYFSPWLKDRLTEDFHLPVEFELQLGQSTCKIGDGIVKTKQVSFGTELCEELFTPASPHIDMSLQGVEIFTNGSASHHEFQKLNRRIDLIREATLKCGGVYLYANQQGCDGERVYYDGSALIFVNGILYAQSSQFSLSDVEVIAATIDIDQVTTFRASNVSRSNQAARAPTYPFVHTNISFQESQSKISVPIPIKLLSANEEIRYGPACWLWDYLRRSKQNGFFLPLSGGIDSCSTAVIVYSMCQMVFKKILEEDKLVLNDLRNIVKQPNYMPSSPQDICGKIFYTCYMGTKNSGAETTDRAKKLADAIGSNHIHLNIDGIILAILAVFQITTGKIPEFRINGGTNAENLALQNIQARTRMIVAYLFAQLLLWSRGLVGSLLVLGSSNVDETLRGYLTKYDCSSADLNPIGGISKVDLREFIKYMSREKRLDLLCEFLDAPPSAELEPRSDNYEQTDEADMGMTYLELSKYGTLRKVHKLGPVSMFSMLLNEWDISPAETARKVKHFFVYYGINRHKTTVLPPSYHMSAYSPDDNRFDLRPFLYPAWTFQFSQIDDKVKILEK